MARRLYLWLPCLTVLALSACSGSDTGFFSPVLTAGAGGSSHAGASSNAGSPSSAGSPSHAGAPDSAGQSSAGGDSGGARAGGANSGGANSGGSAGATPGGGGASGNGARAGAGGSVASGGRGGANGGSANAGAGGSKPDSTCNELIKQANQQLETARECNPAADALQCTGKVTNQCGCQVPVQRTDSAATKAYLKTLQMLEDKNCIIACTAVACPSVTNADCKAAGTGSMGTCVSAEHDWNP